ncbi:hypothetical protein RsS62_37290 [Rhizobium dioscoreae]|nr:hypothetical protein RsS62_37290 [Rhizobium dioscoreae]
MCRDDFRIDQNAVAVEDDEVEAIAHEIAAFDVAEFGTLQETIGVSEHALKNDRRALHDMSAKLNQLAGMAALQ